VSAREARPQLRLVHDAEPAQVEWSWFCGRCAAPSLAGEPPVPTARVCPSCGMGVLLETLSDAVPDPADAFLVVDSKLLVQAMSGPAERLLAVREESAVDRPIVELLWPADAEASRADPFIGAVTAAATGGEGRSHAFVRPWNTYGVRIRARIATCGPPRAALLVLERAANVGLRPV
jgi:hypothetical protein